MASSLRSLLGTAPLQIQPPPAGVQASEVTRALQRHYVIRHETSQRTRIGVSDTYPLTFEVVMVLICTRFHVFRDHDLVRF